MLLVEVFDKHGPIGDLREKSNEIWSVKYAPQLYDLFNDR